MAVSEAVQEGVTEFRCKDCHGRVRLHARHVAHGPAPHVEHRSKQDSEYCPFSGNILVVVRGYGSAPLNRAPSAWRHAVPTPMSEIKEPRIAVLAYGSLLAHPGDWLSRNMQQLIRCETPFGVEYLWCAKNGRGGAPTLMRSDAHRKVLGGLITLPHTDTEEGLTNHLLWAADGGRCGDAGSVEGVEANHSIPCR
jgi:hypothetical protein